jgi:density-regulated protein DRP1
VRKPPLFFPAREERERTLVCKRKMVASAWTKHPSAIAFEDAMCAECKLPSEYCEFSPSCGGGGGGKSKKKKNDEDDDDGVVSGEKMDKMSLEEGGGEEGATKKKEKDENKEKKKKKKEKAKCITITLTSRNKRKMITNVQGFEHFSEKFPDGLKEVAKSFGKKFACGCSVTKGATNQDEIDLQGEYGEQIKEILVQKWKMEEELVIVVDKSKK